jgi:hypothetical protein
MRRITELKVEIWALTNERPPQESDAQRTERWSKLKKALVELSHMTGEPPEFPALPGVSTIRYFGVCCRALSLFLRFRLRLPILLLFLVQLASHSLFLYYRRVKFLFCDV